RRAREIEHLAHPLQSEGFAYRGDRVVHVDDLRTIKGWRSCRSRAMCRISTSMVSSPTRCAASSGLTSNGSVWYDFQSGFNTGKGKLTPLLELDDCYADLVITPTS
ncbi:MAG: hypothetical protein VB142_04605, partial [Burkholderia sp.]